MVLDASAIVAILNREEGYRHMIARMENAEELSTCGLSVLEAVLALHRIDRIPITAAEAIVAAFLQEAGIVLIPMAEAETRAAIAAYARYGKGQGHPAQLNLGDCFSYACARTQGAPLLYVGNDFSQTDIPSALT